MTKKTGKTNTKTEANQLRGGLEPAVRVRKTGRGDVLEIPIATGNGRLNLPDNPGEYLAPSRPGGRPETDQEKTVRRMHANGKSVEAIVVATGCHQISVCKLLGLPLDGKEFETTKLNLETRRRV